MDNKRKHWENIYSTKALQEVSWYQPVPETSLQFFVELDIPKNASIIDVGGGDSFLVDYLLDLGYTDLSVLDISENALTRAKERLKEKAELVHWIHADASKFIPERNYDVWHDRAAFHFLTTAEEIENYVQTCKSHITENGVMILGTFSENGPKKCSGIEIKQYSKESMTQLLMEYFEKVKCIEVAHQTPFDTIQNFIFCSFRKK
ncbi:MAG: class I SAM-dependent methyltransferase [Sphingobacteriaceae bacterium]|nr:class I SAM-dependent methyltransferase [Sphingobacteriaceae bacterium]